MSMQAQINVSICKLYCALASAFVSTVTVGIEMAGSGSECATNTRLYLSHCVFIACPVYSSRLTCLKAHQAGVARHDERI